MFKERIYKIWKQFTTVVMMQGYYDELCSKNEYTKSESNSQPSLRAANSLQIVFKERIYKIWKQFTTAAAVENGVVLLCSKNEYTKSESNSQLSSPTDNIWFIVFKERIYKIWKQFTTGSITMSIFRPFQLLGFFNSINKRKISIDKSCNY